MNRFHRSIPAVLSAGLITASLGLAGCNAGSTAAGQAAETQTAAVTAATTATQTMASQMSGGLVGALGVPNLSSTSSSNLAGVLSYCLQNNLTSGTGASGLVSAVTQKAGVSGSPAYSAGQQGILQAVSNQTATQQQCSLSTLAQPIRQRVCSTVESQLQRMM